MKYRFVNVLFLLAALGCGDSSSTMQQAEVSGTVSYQGRPLPGGMISFLSERGFQNSAVISPDGHFRIKAAVGRSKVTIDNRMLSKQQKSTGPRLKNRPDSAEASPTVEGTYVPLPEKYLSADESGLTYDVQKGTQTHDFQL